MLTIQDLFNDDAKNPFFYDLNLGDNLKEGPQAIFENVKNIFIQGLVIISNGEVLNKKDKSINIDMMTDDYFKKVRERMLSIGIESKYKIYDLSDKDFLLRGLCYQLEKIPDIEISVTLDWKTQYINKVDFHLKDKEVLPKLYEAVEKNSEVNYFLNVLPPTKLKDYSIRYIKKEEQNKLHGVYFDVAKITDYQYQHKFCDEFTKHVR